MPSRIRRLLLLFVLAGCGAAAEERAPPPTESSPLETGMIAHAEQPAVVAVDVDRRIDALAGRVMECVAGRPSLSVEIGVRRSGTIYEVNGDDVGTARACVRNALLGARVSTPLTSDLMLQHTFTRPPPGDTHPAANHS